MWPKISKRKVKLTKKLLEAGKSTDNTHHIPQKNKLSKKSSSALRLAKFKPMHMLEDSSNPNQASFCTHRPPTSQHSFLKGPHRQHVRLGQGSFARIEWSGVSENYGPAAPLPIFQFLPILNQPAAIVRERTKILSWALVPEWLSKAKIGQVRRFRVKKKKVLAQNIEFDSGKRHFKI